jgi:hypothetical protein
MNRIVILSLSTVLVATAAVAYEMHHPNLRDAFGDADNAIHHVQQAQMDNRGVEFGGHAEKAIEAFRHAQQELIEGDKWNAAHHH